MAALTEDVTGLTRDMVASAIKSALQPMIGQPITEANIEAVKATVAMELQKFYSANDVDFPLLIRVTAGRVREVLGKPTHVPADATLWLTGQRVEVETDAATRALKVAMSYDGEWRHGDSRWKAAESETVMGLGLEL